MNQSYQMFSFILSSFLIYIASQPVFAQNSELAVSKILYKYEEKILKDSNWGKIPAFQKGLSETLLACGKSAIGVDGKFGRDTRTGIIDLPSCPGFEGLTVSSAHPLWGTVHTALWKRLLPDTPLPTVHERAFSLSLTHEGTDYNRVEWNYGTADDKSALTWGPFGATVGWGNEVRGILRRVHERNDELLKDTFGEEFLSVSKLMKEDARMGYELMKGVHDDLKRRENFKKKLQALGTTAEGRAAYDWFAFESNEWLKPNFKKFYILIPNAESTATEIDYAYFLDLGMHAGIKRERIDDCQNAIRAREEELGRSLTPSERRQVIGNVFVNAINQRWRKDRMGRNVVFYIDGIPQEDLSEEEVNAWNQRSGLRASNFGLSDNRNYFPNFLR